MRTSTAARLAAAASASLLVVTAVLAGDPSGMVRHAIDAVRDLPGGIGTLAAPPEPPDNRSTPAKIELGHRLFFETRLSLDQSMSCATCHDPEKGFADGRPTAIGFGGKTLGRHTPTALNAAYNEPQFWDGRANGLEEQAVGPIQAAGEMNLSDEAELVRRLESVPRYRALFQEVFGGRPSLQRVGQAIAAYERTLITPNSRFDAYAGGAKNALSDAEKRGLLLFVGKAACTQCHLGPNFTDNKFYAVGVARQDGSPDLGRYEVTKAAVDRAAFKTPTLRNSAITAPYMHDGSLATLRDVLDFYDRGGDDLLKSDMITELGLSDREKQDLVAFLESLTGTVEAARSRPPVN